MRIKFKGFKKDDGSRGPCRIRGERYEPEKIYNVDAGLASWMIARDLAEKIEEEEAPELFEGQPKEAPAPVPLHLQQEKPTEKAKPAATAYEKFIEIVGPHTVQIYGAAGTGKSRFVFAVATEAQQVLGKKVLYLDTEGSLPSAFESELDHYEYIGPDLDGMIERVRLAKKQRGEFDLLILDSVGFPVLTAYASMPLETKLNAILSLTNVMADCVRFARASKHENLPKPEKMNLSIITNQPVSEFARVTQDLPETSPLDPFGGKISFVPKLTLRAEVIKRGPGASTFKLVTHKARHLEWGKEIANYTITDKGVTIEWKI